MAGGDTGEKSDSSSTFLFNNLDLVIRKNIKRILVFILALVFIITFSNPAIFLNDEWVTVNQLNQLEKGHQVVFNEGKYGVFKDGTPGPYFLQHNNKLGYSLMLPIFSLPALSLFGLFGDQFRLFVILLWAGLAMLAFLLIWKYFPGCGTISGIKWTHIGVLVVLFLTLLNIILYNSWPFTNETAPREVAAVVFTNHILFALAAVVIYTIYAELIKDEWAVLFSAFATFCCSSFLFWAANAKDHILVLVLFALTVLFFIRYIKNEKYPDLALSFIFIGLTAWARPEVGFSVFLCSFVFIAIFQGFRIRSGEVTRTFARILSTVLFTLLGAIPLFLNNYFVTGNPLKLSFYIFGESAVTMQKPLLSSGGVLEQNIFSTISTSFSNSLVQTFSFYSISFDTYPGDLAQVLFLPQSGTISFIALCPLVIVAMALGFRYFLRKDSLFEVSEKNIIAFLVFITGAVFLAYSNTLSMLALTTEAGIIPDLRYLSPAYLTINIIAMILLHKSGILQSAKKMLVNSIVAALICTPVLPYLILVVIPSAGNFYSITRIFILLSMSLALITSLFLCISRKSEMQNTLYEKILPLLIVMPFVWQMLMLFMFSPAKFNGYTFWIPESEILFHLFVY